MSYKAVKFGVIENSAVIVRDQRIVAVGTTDELKASYRDEPTIDKLIKYLRD